MRKTAISISECRESKLSNEPEETKKGPVGTINILQDLVLPHPLREVEIDNGQTTLGTFEIYSPDIVVSWLFVGGRKSSITLVGNSKVYHELCEH